MRRPNRALFFLLATTVTEYYLPDRLKCIIVNVHNFKISKKVNRKKFYKIGNKLLKFSSKPSLSLRKPTVWVSVPMPQDFSECTPVDAALRIWDSGIPSRIVGTQCKNGISSLIYNKNRKTQTCPSFTHGYASLCLCREPAGEDLNFSWAGRWCRDKQVVENQTAKQPLLIAMLLNNRLNSLWNCSASYCPWLLPKL